MAILLPNLLQYPVALLGALRAGLVVVNANPLSTASELRFQLADSGASAVVALEQFAHTLDAALTGTAVRHVVATAVGDLLSPLGRVLVRFAQRHAAPPLPAWRIAGLVGLRHALARGAAHALEDAPVGPDDPALLQYTGGTTGRPRGAILTHGNLVANVEQTHAWIGAALEPGHETVVTILPLYHAFALTANLLVFLRLGGRNVLVADPRDTRRLFRTLARTRFTAFTGVDTLYKALLDDPRFERVRRANAGRVKVAIAGGMALERAVAERWREAMGVGLTEGYGLTEAAPIVCANRLDAPAFTGKLGLPLPSTDVAIVDAAGHPVAAGEAGEICVRGPQVMRGYWNAPEETALAFTADGWLRTGDIGRMDAAGYVAFVDRSKDVIVVSGFKAYPHEIEAVARAHPGVADAAAVAVPDPRRGEVVGLFAVRRDAGLTTEALRAHCARHLAPYKRPRRIAFVEHLPRSAIGKTLHRALREAAPEEGSKKGSDPFIGPR